MISLLLSAALAAEVTFDDAVRAGAGAPAGRIVEAQAASARAELHGSSSWANPGLAWADEPDRQALEFSLPVGLAPLARAAAAKPAGEAIDMRERLAISAAGAAAGAAWLDARRAADHAAAAAKMEGFAVRLASAAEAQVASGEWSQTAGVLARADAARALDRALSWEQEAARASARLGVLIGGPVETLGAWPEVPTPPVPDLAATPAVLAADLEARAALANRFAARLALIPAIEVSAGYAWGDVAGPTTGASIAIPLFAPGASAVRRSSAQVDQTAAQADLAALDAAATLAAVLGEESVAQRLAAAWDIPGIDTVLESTVRLYDAGELSLPDYLAQRDLAVLATQNAIDARWRLARARLAGWELNGTLPPEGDR